MRPTPFYFFEHTPPGARKPVRTTYRMTIEQAAERLPGWTPVEWTKEIRNLPDDGDLVNGGMGFLATKAQGFTPWAAHKPPLDPPPGGESPPAPAP